MITSPGHPGSSKRVKTKAEQGVKPKPVRILDKQALIIGEVRMEMPEGLGGGREGRNWGQRRIGGVISKQ